jgi:hypothetical protein
LKKEIHGRENVLTIFENLRRLERKKVDSSLHLQTSDLLPLIVSINMFRLNGGWSQFGKPQDDAVFIGKLSEQIRARLSEQHIDDQKL